MVFFNSKYLFRVKIVKFSGISSTTLTPLLVNSPMATCLSLRILRATAFWYSSLSVPGLHCAISVILVSLTATIMLTLDYSIFERVHAFAFEIEDKESMVARILSYSCS